MRGEKKKIFLGEADPCSARWKRSVLWLVTQEAFLVLSARGTLRVDVGLRGLALVFPRLLAHVPPVQRLALELSRVLRHDFLRSTEELQF